MSSEVNLAMPFGLPAEGANLLAHYSALKEEVTFEQLADNTVRMIITDRLEWCSIHTMCRCMAILLPTGSTAPNGAVLLESAVIIKPWFWDFLRMSESANGSVLPSKILYTNIDISMLRTDIRNEIGTNERYSSLSMSEKTSLENDFLTGTAKLLLDAETKIGLGQVISSGEHSGKRSCDIQFYDYDNNLMDPSDVSEIFNLVGGRTISNHPYSDFFSRVVWPNIVPVEGNLRFKLTGELVFSEHTEVSIGGTPVHSSQIRLSPDRRILYGTFPLRESTGAVDVVVQNPGEPAQNFTDAVTYVEDLVSTLKASLISFQVYLSEVKSLIQDENERGVLNPNKKEEWSLDFGFAKEIINHVIYERSERSDQSLILPELSRIWETGNDLISEMSVEIKSILNS